MHQMIRINSEIYLILKTKRNVRTTFEKHECKNIHEATEMGMTAQGDVWRIERGPRTKT